jgi:phosphomannomutase
VLALADGEAIRARGFRVLLDANGGAGGPLASMLLEALGCAVVAVGAEPDGHFRHPPEPIPAHLAGIGPLVPQSRADVGFVLDPDADRLALVDEAGRCLSEELTLALAVRQRLRRARGPVVINLSTSRAVEDLAEEAGVPCHRSAVGEANVVARMRSEEALIGGEGNGGVIDPRVGWVRDPFVGMALVLGLLAEEGRPLSEAAACLPEYHIVKEKVDVDRAAVPRLLERLEADWPHPASADRRDGLRLGGPWGWVQVRPSNTEPIVRVIAEAADEAGARCLCKTARRLLLAG